ncbi:MAG: hypothetical protein BGN86_16510 [Caulobacterales bacterium 68-7]|nr:MAG: hypothetical protein BGN86_16510 [Caulobacterales bacterium 68-7]
MANYDSGDIAITAMTVAGHILIKLRDKGVLTADEVNDILRGASADIHPDRQANVSKLLEEVFQFK